MKLLSRLLILLLLGAAIGLGWVYHSDIAGFIREKSGTETESTPTPDLTTYLTLIEELNNLLYSCYGNM